MQTTAEYLSSLREERELTVRQLCQALGYQGEVAGTVSMVLRGKRRLSPKQALRWADALRLEGADRTDWLIITTLDGAPEEVRDYWQWMEQRLASLTRQVERLDARLRSRQ